MDQTSGALQATRAFLSHMTDQLPSDEEQRWFISTLHALEHTIRLADAIKENVKIEPGTDGIDGRRAVELCARAMRSTSSITTLLVHSPVLTSEEPRPIEQCATLGVGSVGTDPPPELGKAIACLENCSAELADLLPLHRRATLEAVASGTLTANDAISHVEAVRFLDRLAHHAWRASAHIAGAIVPY